MPVVDFYEFMVYEGIEPFGGLRGDVQAAMVCATLANVNRGKETDKIYTPEDFMPRWEPVPPPAPKTPEQQLEIFLMIQKAQNESLN